MLELNIGGQSRCQVDQTFLNLCKTFHEKLSKTSKCGPLASGNTAQSYTFTLSEMKPNISNFVCKQHTHTHTHTCASGQPQAPAWFFPSPERS